MIKPTGKLMRQMVIMDTIKKNHNSDSKIKLWVEDVQSVSLQNSTILATYHELQIRDGCQTKRISTAIFHESSAAPNGYEWLNLHRLNCTDTIFVTILRCYNRATDMSPTPDAYSF